MKRAIRSLLGRLKPLAINTAVAGCALGFALVVAELAVRLVAPQQLIQIRPDLWQPADTVGWLHRPNVRITINTGEGTVRVFTDADGFRVGERGRIAGGTKVLLLGDSFMEALQVEHERSTAGLLESMMPEILDRPVEVHNAAIGGWDPDQYLLRARSLLPGNEYELVITAIYLGNDVVSRRREYLPPREPVRRYSFRLPGSLAGPELADAFLRPLNDLLEVRSHAYLLVKNRLQTVRMRLGLAVLTFPPQYLVSEADTERWTVTAELATDIATVASQHGAEALFVLIPAPFQLDSADLKRYVEGFDIDPSAIDLDQPNRKLGDELAARGLEVRDALPAFRAAYQRGRRLYGAVDQHFTPDGHELFAELVTGWSSDVLSAAHHLAPEGR